MKPSVTKLIDLLEKPALIKWANKIGLQGIKLDDYRSESRGKGTDYHLAVESFLKYGLVPEDEMLANNMQNFFKDKEVIAVEQDIENEYFVGRLDIKFKYKDFVFVGDFKSNTKGIYLENKIQLAAYAMIEKCHICIIHLPDFLFHPVSIDHNIYEEFIITLSKLYNLKQQIER